MRYSGAQGTLIYEKNLKSKISCQTPFNPFIKILFFVKLAEIWGGGGIIGAGSKFVVNMRVFTMC